MSRPALDPPVDWNLYTGGVTAPTLTEELVVVGMTCSACTSRVERALADADGVSNATVNLATGRTSIIHDGSMGSNDLAAIVEGIGYSVVDTGSDDAAEAEARRTEDFRRRFLIGAVLTVPAMVLSMIAPLQFDGWRWVVAALATPVVWWSGWPFHRAAAANLAHRATTMDTLVSMGSLAAWTWSAVVLVFDVGDHIYFETGAVIVTLILLGKWLELRARKRSGDAIRSLIDLGARSAVLEDGTEVALDDVAVGMRFLVKPGEKVATDGIVVAGRSSVDTSMVTGEPVPVDVGIGDEVIGATINTDGSLTVEATRVGSETALAQIVELVERAQGSRAEVQRLADRISSVFVPAALVISLLTLIGWLVTGNATHQAFTAAVAVLIISCPCALGLATPLGIMVGTGRGAQLGVIIKGGEVLEATRHVDVVVLDKTGTVTEGRMHVSDTHAPGLNDQDAADLWRAAASVEALSEHPIATAVSALTDGRDEVASFENWAGFGVTGWVGGSEVRVGKRKFFDQIAPELEAAAVAAESTGATAVFAGRGGMALGVIVVRDRIKATSAAAIEALHDQGLSITMLTGDNARAAATVAQAVGVDDVIAEVLPADKAAVIEQLQAAGHRVAMVGDGINDAPALAQADLGIAIGTGTDVAIEASDLTAVSGDLGAVADAIALARRTLVTIRGNLFWAFAYNAAAIPLAAFGVLNPMVAAGAMGLSSLFVVTNSLRLRRFSGYRSPNQKVSP